MVGLAGISTFPSAVIAQTSAAEALIFLTPSTLSLSFAAELYADVSRKFNANQVAVRIEVGRGAAQTVQLVAANQVQIGRSGGGNYLAARAQNNSDVIAFATIAQTSPFSIISSEKAPIAKAADLRGKSIGLPSFGGTAEATLNLILASAQIELSEVRKERVAYSPATFALIESRRLDAFFANTSAVARLKAEKIPAHVFEVDDGVPGQVYVAREENLSKSSNTYVAFLRSVLQSVRELSAMDDNKLREAIKLIQTKYEIPGIEKGDTALQDIKAARQLWNVNGVARALRNDEARWTGGQQVLEKIGAIKPINRPAYTNEIWNRAAK